MKTKSELKKSFLYKSMGVIKTLDDFLLNMKSKGLDEIKIQTDLKINYKDPICDYKYLVILETKDKQTEMYKKTITIHGILDSPADIHEQIQTQDYNVYQTAKLYAEKAFKNGFKVTLQGKEYQK